MDRLQQFESPKARYVLTSESTEQTLEIGRRIGQLLPSGSVLSLEGGLGVGKTLLVKGICAGLGVDSEVLSPSFILLEEYRGELPVLHFDLFRLDDMDDVMDVGLFDAIDGCNIVIVEWGDRLPQGVLGVDIRVTMRITGPESREIFIEAYKNFLEALEEA